MPNRIYLTTTLPYVNADPHIGFAAELVHADVMTRFYLLMGHEVFLNTGTDEHGLKIFRNAQAAGEDVQVYVDRFAAKFKQLLPALGVWEGANFIRTTDPDHIAAAQEFWRRSVAAGDIYKKQYKIKYCVGCELEKTESELTAGRCPLHPNLELETIEEENYFFRFSKYQKPLLELYVSRPDLVIPDYRFNEIKAFVERGLEDFSISRLASKMPWGVPVPDDTDQVMYVWFDALVNYVAAIGWPKDEEKFKNWWAPARPNGRSGGVTQFAGKDNLRQQSAMWQAMLMSVGLPPSKQIVIRGFVTAEGGQKMSKSLGNVINPLEVSAEYGPEALRYFLVRHLSPFEDSPVTLERIKESYNSGLANGLGNLVSRVLKMSSTNLEKPIELPPNTIPQEFLDLLEKFEIQKAADLIWQKISEADLLIQQTEPFKLIKTDRDAALKIIQDLCFRVYVITQMLEPFLPETSATIKQLVKENKMPEKPLFLRK